MKNHALVVKFQVFAWRKTQNFRIMIYFDASWPHRLWEWIGNGMLVWFEALCLITGGVIIMVEMEVNLSLFCFFKLQDDDVN